MQQGTCECGCGELVSPGKRFRPGHWARVQPKRNFGLAPVCKCGCGLSVERRPGKWLQYASGHYFRARRPRHAPFVDHNPSFWDWFAGFVDGEGSFGIAISSGGPSTKRYSQPHFKLTVRADERPILEEIRERLGCGRIRVHVPGGSTSNLQLSFLLTSSADCQRLVEVLTLHPLRAKKRNDFKIWAEAVQEKAANGTSERLFELRERLIAGRRYDHALAEGGAV
jgi:hypothetical protein